ncbi:MAG: chemotaxis protein CheX [Bradymonadia bacterium]
MSTALTRQLEAVLTEEQQQRARLDTYRKVFTILRDSTQGLYAAYGVELGKPQNRVPNHRDKMGLSAVVGFTCDNVQGNMSLLTCTSALMATRPVEQIEVEDWIGELANQLSGRIKNQMLRYGVTLQLAPPIIFYGDRLRVWSPPEEISLRMMFGSDAGEIAVTFSARAVRGQTIVLADTQSHIQREGEIVLFDQQAM